MASRKQSYDKARRREEKRARLAARATAAPLTLDAILKRTYRAAAALDSAIADGRITDPATTGEFRWFLDRWRAIESRAKAGRAEIDAALVSGDAGQMDAAIAQQTAQAKAIRAELAGIVRQFALFLADVAAKHGIEIPDLTFGGMYPCSSIV